jgi:hypothetical protein
MERT